MYAALSVLAILGATHAVPQDASWIVVMPRHGGSVQGTGIEASQVEANHTCEPEVLRYHMLTSVKYRYATTLVHSKMVNCGGLGRQLNFSVTLPETAFLTSFLIEADGNVYRSYVRERDAADVEYQQAVKSGVAAAHVSLSVRDSRVYHVLIHVEPRSDVTFNLTYEEMLTRRHDLYHLVVTPDPGQSVRDLLVDVTLHESRKLKRVTALSSRVTDLPRLDPATPLALAPPPVVRRPSARTAHIAYRPYAAPGQGGSSKAFGGGQQLTVAYDVDRRSQAGDVLLMDGYFVHFFSPRSLTPLPKHVIFSLDTSGSMWGRKLRQTQEAMHVILASLREGDYFSIVTFATDVKVWTPHEYSYNLVGLRGITHTHEVNAENVALAQDYIKAIKAEGGTNIDSGLKKSIQIAAKQEYKTARRDLKTSKPPQPIIVFLTDGIPTNGDLRHHKILSTTRDANTEVKAAIFSLAFGSEASRVFLRKLSLQNNGFSRRIYEAADAAAQLQSFYHEISSPLLSNVTFVYKGNQVNKSSVTRNTFHSYYGGSELVVAGQILGNADGNSTSATGAHDEAFGTETGTVDGATPRSDLFEIEILATSSDGEKLLVNKKKLGKRKQATAFAFDRPHGVLEKMWAAISVRQHLERAMMGDDLHDGPKVNHTKQALSIALKYQFVTPLTSLVVSKSTNTSSLTELSSVVLDQEDDGSFKRNVDMDSAFDKRHESSPSGLPFGRPMPFSPLHRPADVDSTIHDEVELTLNELSWLSDRLDSSGRLAIPVHNGNEGGTFTIDKDTTKNGTTVKTCTTPDGKTGTCQMLVKCIQLEFAEDFGIFLDYFCAIGNRAGVCCHSIT